MNNEVWPVGTAKRVNVMIDKIDGCLKRVLDSKPDANATIMCKDGVIHVKPDGLI